MIDGLPPEQNNTENNYPLIDGISAKLIPQKSENMTFPKTVFAFGIFREELLGSTSEKYSPSGYGFSLGIYHQIRSIWKGGIDLRWSDWIANSTSNIDTSPLSIFSKIEGVPPLKEYIGEYWGSIFQPYFTGGLGYTMFFNSRSWLAARAKTSFGQMSATYGIGFRVTLPKSFAVKFSLENWRGIETTEYSGQIYRMEIVFGDVDNY